MTTEKKQQLIEWMLKKRADFTFESKVEMVWDYWENKHTIPNLKKDVASWQSAYQIERTRSNDLSNQITSKDDRIAQLDQSLKGSSQIFTRQQLIIDDLIKGLESEKKKNTGNVEYQDHLQKDILRLAGERKDLDKNLIKLQEEERRNKQLRDQEIADLRKELENLKLVEKEINRINEELTKKNVSLDLSNHDLQSFDFTHYPELEFLDISNNLFSPYGKAINLTANNKLKYLDISSGCSFNKVNFGDNKKTLEELHFVSRIRFNCSITDTIDLREFTNLKKISYSWEIKEVWLNKNLEGKVTISYIPWQKLDEEEKKYYSNSQHSINTNYEGGIKARAVYKS